MKDLQQIYQNHQDKVADKWQLYLVEYERLFSPYRHKEVRLLEIGVQNGGSLEIWSRYFEKGILFLGCDINQECGSLHYEDPRIKVVTGDVNNGDTRRSIIQQSHAFEIIIDDGSHLSADIIRAFSNYFDNVNDGGVFVVEDLHCSYWQEFEGGLYYPYSSMAFFKRLADIINQQHWGNESNIKAGIEEFIQHFSLSLSEKTLREIHSVEFMNSMCVIRKKSMESNQLGPRWIVGKNESICAVKQLNKQILKTPAQNENFWSAMSTPPEFIYAKALTERDGLTQALAATVKALEELSDRFQKINQQLADRETHINLLEQSVVDRDDQIIILKQRLGDRDSHSAELAQALRDRDDQLAELNRLTHDFKAKLDRIENSLSEVLEKNARLKSRKFNSKYYLESNPDVAAAGLNPLVHYLFHGQKEGRRPIPPKSFIALIPPAIEGRGGLVATIRKALRKYRDHGLKGLKEGIAKVRALDSKNTSNNPYGGLGNDYTEWVKRYDTLDDNQREAMRQQINRFANKPLISIIMPVYNPPIRFLELAIQSVQKQLYPRWELCIADDASTDRAIRKTLERYASADDRIKIVFREVNGHISAASNSALALATGEFIALMDHDDLLPEHALFWIASTINENPGVGLIYSDEDKINEAGLRYDPYFKPELDPLLLLAQNMISHLGVYRASLVHETGGFRLGFEGAQDYDLALRVLEKIDRGKAKHIPRILYHWRAIAGSTALLGTEKDYAAKAGLLAVSGHLERAGVKARVIPAPEAPQLNRVIFEIPQDHPLVSIIIPTRDQANLLEVCIHSILGLSTYPHYEIIIIDNGSVENKTIDLFQNLPKSHVRVLRNDSPFNYSALNNLGAQVAKGELLCLLNNDMEVLTPGWLEEMLSFATQPDVGCVGARLWYPDGRLQHGGVITGIGGVAGHAHKYLSRAESGYFARAVLHQSLSAVTAACLMVRREIFEQMKGLDEKLAVAFNDIDFCLRVKAAGYRNVWTPYAEMYHHESATRGYEDNPDKIARFHQEMNFMLTRWGDELRHDPAYNPNLTLDNQNFSLAWPPRLSCMDNYSQAP